MHSVKAELKLDEAATPKAMDWIRVTRDGQEAPDVPAIYDLQGDTLTIRNGHRPGDPRPSEFRTDPKGDPDQVVFARQKAESNQARE